MMKFHVFGAIVVCIILIAGCCTLTNYPKRVSQNPNSFISNSSYPQNNNYSVSSNPIKTYECPDGKVVTELIQCEKTKCSDGTQIGSCSQLKPKYCNSQGELIDDSVKCACEDPLVYEPLVDRCVNKTCEDGTEFIACSKINKGKLCNVNRTLVDAGPLCGCPSGQISNGTNCIFQTGEQDRNSYTFTSYQNKEPYYSAFCEKIDPFDLSVREAASNAIRKDPGAYSTAQLFDIYDWVKANVIYQNVPLGGVPYSASQTLATKSGDCKNQAVLIASMIQSIGGKARVVLDPSCKHAYAIVYYGPAGSETSSFANAVTNHYGTGVVVRTMTQNNEIWMVFDPAGGVYPGQTLPECTGQRDVYYVDTCMMCSNQYPNAPYTLGEKCFATCPSGTISTNQHSCTPCPDGWYSLNNQCLSCPAGYVLGTDGKCYPQCGGPNLYCPKGRCYNNRCVA